MVSDNQPQVLNKQISEVKNVNFVITSMLIRLFNLSFNLVCKQANLDKCFCLPQESLRSRGLVTSVLRL